MIVSMKYCLSQKITLLFFLVIKLLSVTWKFYFGKPSFCSFKNPSILNTLGKPTQTLQTCGKFFCTTKITFISKRY